MARKITQAMFDSVVLENIEEFEMTPEEAVVEAVQQFEAQGVNLDTIVKESRSRNGADDGAGTTSSKHRVVEAVENLRRCAISDEKSVTNSAVKNTGTDVTSGQTSSGTFGGTSSGATSSTSGGTTGGASGRTSLCDALTALQSCCNSSLAERCLAADSGAYALLLTVLQDAVGRPDWSLVAAVLECLSSLITGHPDVLDDAGTEALLELLRKSSDSEIPVAQVLLVVRHGCVMHEENRQRFVAGDLITLISSVLTSSTRRSDRRTVTHACAVYGALTLDDDVRVPFGKGHEHARMIVGEADAIAVLLNLTSEYADDVDVLGELFATVGRLAVRDEFCQQVLKLDGLKNILAALRLNVKNQGFVRAVLGVLKALCGSDPVKVEVVRCGGAELVLDCINTHARSAGISEIGCATIAALVLRHPANCAEVMKCQAAECIVRCLQLHAGSSSVQKQASMAIRNLVSRCPEHCAPFLELGAEALLRSAISAHPNTLDDEAKAALRDLDCSVELKELWLGTGRDLIHD